MQYFVFDSRYIQDKETKPLFASNDKQETITAAEEIGQGMTVIRRDESGLEKIVYVSKYKLDLGIVE